MFASSYLKEFGAPDDWICVYDFNGRFSSLSRTVDISAWWSPSRKRTEFGNNWGDVIPRPSAKQPTAAQIDTWVHEHPGWLQRAANGALKRDKMYKDHSAAVQAFFTKRGCGVVHVEFSNGFVHDGPIGIRTRLEMLPTVTDYMLEKLPPGTRLTRLTVTRNGKPCKLRKPPVFPPTPFFDWDSLNKRYATYPKRRTQKAA